VPYETDESATATVGRLRKAMPQSRLDRQKTEVAKRVALPMWIMTALIPSRRRCVTEEMVKSMKPGSVTADLAVEAVELSVE
jgi:NAD/NADP transhydrogenase alpha subunit